jgi:hypothetical protein
VAFFTAGTARTNRNVLVDQCSFTFDPKKEDRHCIDVRESENIQISRGNTFDVAPVKDVEPDPSDMWEWV